MQLGQCRQVFQPPAHREREQWVLELRLERKKNSRLQREREMLEWHREQLEQERAERERLQRERLRVERELRKEQERIHREREELRRQQEQLRYEQERRPAVRRPYDDRYDERYAGQATVERVGGQTAAAPAAGKELASSLAARKVGCSGSHLSQRPNGHWQESGSGESGLVKTWRQPRVPRNFDALSKAPGSLGDTDSSNQSCNERPKQ